MGVGERHEAQPAQPRTGPAGPGWRCAGAGRGTACSRICAGHGPSPAPMSQQGRQHAGSPRWRCAAWSWNRCWPRGCTAASLASCEVRGAARRGGPPRRSAAPTAGRAPQRGLQTAFPIAPPATGLPKQGPGRHGGRAVPHPPGQHAARAGGSPGLGGRRHGRPAFPASSRGGGQPSFPRHKAVNGEGKGCGQAAPGIKAAWHRRTDVICALGLLRVRRGGAARAGLSAAS